jgi:hypothetical protein
MGFIKRKKTKAEFFAEELDKLDVNEDISKETIVCKVWTNNKYPSNNNFDVVFFHAKKLIPNKRFYGNAHDGLILRTN